MNFHRSQEAFVPTGDQTTDKGDGVRRDFSAQKFCLTAPISRGWVLHPDLLTREEDGKDFFPHRNFCARCLSLFQHCIGIDSGKVPGRRERREPASGPTAEHDVGRGAAIVSGARAECDQGRLEVRPFLDALDKELLDILDGCFHQPVGLWVVWVAGIMVDAIVLAVRFEGLATELRSSIRADGFGEAKVLKPLHDCPGDGEEGGGGQTVNP